MYYLFYSFKTTIINYGNEHTLLLHVRTLTLGRTDYFLQWHEEMKEDCNFF